ncbi:hypothetical protein Pan258_46250 [Symmachiella dynata]|nr:hypothetical protein Pan258_46250 [Symmachiella dynata]
MSGKPIRGLRSRRLVVRIHSGVLSGTLLPKAGEIEAAAYYRLPLPHAAKSSQRQLVVHCLPDDPFPSRSLANAFETHVISLVLMSSNLDAVVENQLVCNGLQIDFGI